MPSNFTNNKITERWKLLVVVVAVAFCLGDICQWHKPSDFVVVVVFVGLPMAVAGSTRLTLLVNFYNLPRQSSRHFAYPICRMTYSFRSFCFNYINSFTYPVLLLLLSNHPTKAVGRFARIAWRKRSCVVHVLVACACQQSWRKLGGSIPQIDW